MPKEIPQINTPSDPHFFEGKNAKIAWDRKFREMLRAHPGIIKTAIALVDKAIDEYAPENTTYGSLELKYDKETARWLEEKHAGYRPLAYGRGTILVPGRPMMDDKTGLEVVVLGRSNREMQGMIRTRFDKCDYLKLSYDGKSFFVKRSFVTTNPGFIEFSNIQEAKELLKDLPNVGVVDAKMGYQDKNESWYISKWENLETDGFQSDPYNQLNDYGKNKLPAETQDSFFAFENERDYLNYKQGRKLIEEKLKPTGIDRDLNANLFYNPKTKTFILLDVTGGRKGGHLGNAIK